MQVVHNPDTDHPALVDAYQSQINILLDKNAPVKLSSMTLRSHAPWFLDDLRALKREKTSMREKMGQVRPCRMHKQLYRDSANN